MMAPRLIPSFRPRRLVACWLAGMTLATVAIDTADARRFRLGSAVRWAKQGPKPYTADVLSPVQLKACLKAERSLDANGADLDRRADQIRKDQLKIQVQGALIETSKAQVDRYSKRSVDEFNALVTDHNARLKANVAAVTEYDSAVTARKADSDRFNTDCRGKRYYEDDLVTARNELGIIGD